MNSSDYCKTWSVKKYTDGKEQKKMHDKRKLMMIVVKHQDAVRGVKGTVGFEVLGQGAW